MVVFACSIKACEILQVHPPPENISLQDWEKASEMNGVIGLVVILYKTKELDEKLSNITHPELEHFVRQAARLKHCKGVPSQRISQTRQDYSNVQLVLLKKYHLQALKGCHDELGHLGLECMLDLSTDQFYWLNMQVIAKHHVRSCD